MLFKYQLFKTWKPCYIFYVHIILAAIERGFPIKSFRSITKRQWSLILLALLFVLALYFILPISLPLLLALVTALILNPAIRICQAKMKTSRKTSVIMVFILFLMFIAVISTFLVTKAIAELVDFVDDIPRYFNQLNDAYQSLGDGFKHYTENMPPEFVNEVSASLSHNLASLSDKIKNEITIDNITQIFTKIPQYLISFLVYLIALFLFMLELPSVKQNAYKLMRKETAKKVAFMYRRLAEVITGFFKAQFLVSVIIFLASLIGLFIIIPDVAIVMSFVIWVIDFIPIIGSIVILGPWSLFMFVTGDTEMGIKLAVLAIILLGIRRTVEPKVMGKHMGLSPLATLIAMFLGVKLIGIFGFILGPLFLIMFHSAKEAGIIKLNIKI